MKIDLLENFSSKIKHKILEKEGVNIDEKYKDYDFTIIKTDDLYEIPFLQILDDSELFNYMMKEYHPFSLPMLKAVLEVKDSLVEKHKNKELSIEEELLS